MDREQAETIADEAIKRGAMSGHRDDMIERVLADPEGFTLCTMVSAGHAHTKRRGLCGVKVTRAEIEKKFTGIWGGRNFRVSAIDGVDRIAHSWEATAHDD